MIHSSAARIASHSETGQIIWLVCCSLFVCLFVCVRPTWPRLFRLSHFMANKPARLRILFARRSLSSSASSYFTFMFVSLIDAIVQVDWRETATTAENSGLPERRTIGLTPVWSDCVSGVCKLREFALIFSQTTTASKLAIDQPTMSDVAVAMRVGKRPSGSGLAKQQAPLAGQDDATQFSVRQLNLTSFDNGAQR